MITCKAKLFSRPDRTISYHEDNGRGQWLVTDHNEAGVPTRVKLFPAEAFDQAAAAFGPLPTHAAEAVGRGWIAGPRGLFLSAGVPDEFLNPPDWARMAAKRAVKAMLSEAAE